ncbi:MAG: efflux RND transporter periplasmic adaptor subunit [Rhodoferax sp.]
MSTNKTAPWRKRISLGALVVAALALVGYVFTQAGPLAPVRVTTTTVAQGTVQPAIFGIGTVEARTSWNLGPTATGRVLAVAVDVGDTVQAGQVLAEMDPVDQDARLAALDAAAQRARSAQAAAQAQLSEAQARRSLAAQNFQRNQSLADRQFISASALESRQTELQQADAAVAAARANVDSSMQELLRAQAERSGGTTLRGVLRLRAPASGVVVARNAEPGSTLTAGQTLLQIIDPASLWVRMRIDQGRAQALAVGLPARVVLRSRPGAVLAGRVARVEALADSVAEERVAHVALQPDQVNALVTVGELAEITLDLPATARAPVLPNAAVQVRQGQSGVWRLQDGRPHFTPVSLGAASLEGQVQVLQGLSVGDTVVVYSQAPLSEGQRVHVQDSLVADK